MGLIKSLLLLNGAPVRPTTKKERARKVSQQSLKTQQQILKELQRQNRGK
jgi:hypothetical protein